jgi:RHS repeat-associated protein
VESEFFRRAFNGMEVDPEVKGKGNSYDFGARMLDARLGRWLSVDPLASEYPGISSYCFVNNMPVIAIDPNGKEIIIIGTNGQQYKYTPGMSTPNEATVDVQDVIMGLNIAYNNIDIVKKEIDFLVGLNDQGVKIQTTANFGNVNKFYPVGETGTFAEIVFNPNQADKLQNGEVQSPIVGLAHELQHAYNYFDAYEAYRLAETPGEMKKADAKFLQITDPEAEELNATTKGLEPAVAKYFNNGTRSEYEAPQEIMYVGCITCTTPLEPPTEKAKEQIEKTNEALKQQTPSDN